MLETITRLRWKTPLVYPLRRPVARPTGEFKIHNTDILWRSSLLADRSTPDKSVPPRDYHNALPVGLEFNKVRSAPAVRSIGECVVLAAGLVVARFRGSSQRAVSLPASHQRQGVFGQVVRRDPDGT